MKKSLAIAMSLLVLSFFIGCVHVEEFVQKFKGQSATPEAEAPPEKEMVFESRPFWEKALAFEAKEDLQRALIFANIAGEFSPDNNEISEKTAYLRSEIDRRADWHFNEGLKLYKQRKYTSARDQFILALKANPDHEDALGYLKGRLSGQEYKTYRVRKNDTLKDIAEKFYKDRAKDFLIAYLNDLDANGPLNPGTKLKLVTLDSKLIKPAFDVGKALENAASLMEKKAYDDVLNVAEKILEYDRSNQEAQDLKSAAYYQMGTELSRQGRYVEAINTFKKADPQYEGVEGAIQRTTAGELKKAQRLLEEKQYKQAVDVAQQILNHDASNKAARDLTNTATCQMGRDLTTQKEYAKALDLLSRADPEHGCIKQAVSDAAQAAKKQAEVHYLKGVKHFLNEELTDAIKEWKMTLALDPEYEKAEESIQKAQEVLEKLKQVE